VNSNTSEIYLYSCYFFCAWRRN